MLTFLPPVLFGGNDEELRPMMAGAFPDGRKKKLLIISIWLEANNKTDSNKLTDAGSLPPEPNVQNGLNEYLPSAENLSQNTTGVNEPMMPRGNEVYDVKVGDVFVDANGVRHAITKTGRQYTNMTPVDGKKRIVRTGDIESSGFRRLAPEEIKNGVGLPDISNDFGPSFTEQSGKPLAGIAKLMTEKTGQVPGALIAPDGVPVDFIYGKDGEDGYGLAHIYEKHGRKVLAHIPKIIMNGSSIESGNSKTYSYGSESLVLKK